MLIGLDVAKNARVFQDGIDLLRTPTVPSAWTFTGHSLGGGLASAASLVSSLRGATFNAAGLNVNTLRKERPAITEQQMHQQAQGLITAYVVDWDILNNLQDAGDITIDILIDDPTAVGTRVTLDSPLDLQMALGTFKVIGGLVTLIAGGAGGTTSVEGVIQILDTMVTAHGIYVECLYPHIAGQ